MGVDIRRVGPAEWQAMRAIRLEALGEAPGAFGSSLAREQAFGPEEWLARVNGPNVTYLAYLPEIAGLEHTPEHAGPVGIAGGLLYEPEPGTVELVSMWVAPRARGTGVAEALVEVVAAWALDDAAANRVHLWVSEPNQRARKLYERCGFTYTGERQPLPSDPTIPEIAMERPCR